MSKDFWGSILCVNLNQHLKGIRLKFRILMKATKMCHNRVPIQGLASYIWVQIEVRGKVGTLNFPTHFESSENFDWSNIYLHLKYIIFEKNLVYAAKIASFPSNVMSQTKIYSRGTERQTCIKVRWRVESFNFTTQFFTDPCLAF